MALSGSTSIVVAKDSTGADAVWLIYNWSATQDIAKNQSTVSWSLVLKSGTYGQIISSAEKDYSVTTNGTAKTGKCTIAIGNNSSRTLASGSTTVNHNSDGSKSFSYSFSVTFSMTFAGDSIGTKSGSGTGALTTIPRASSIAAANCTLGTAFDITITKATAAFRHTLTYACGTASGTISLSEDSTLSKKFSWTPPLSLAAQNTTGTSVSIVLTLKTFSDSNKSTQIGSTVTKTITGTIPTSVKPSISSLAVEAADTASSGHLTKYGGYVQGKSKIKVTASASTAQGSAIKTYSITVDGKSYTSNPATTSALTGNGSLKASATVTDARGRSSDKKESAAFTVLAYSAPNISRPNVHRCNQDGTESMIGAYCLVSWSASISISAKNSYTVTLMYKKTTASSWTSVTKINGSTLGLSGSYIFAAAIDSAYNVKITVRDDFSTSENSTILSTAESPMHMGQANVSIGKTIGPTKEKFEVGWDEILEGSLTIQGEDGAQGQIMANTGTDGDIYLKAKNAADSAFTNVAHFTKSVFESLRAIYAAVQVLIKGTSSSYPNVQFNEYNGGKAVIQLVTGSVNTEARLRFYTRNAADTAYTTKGYIDNSGLYFDNINSLKRDVTGTSKSVASGTWTQVASFSLEAGSLWLLEAHALFASNSNGRRAMAFANESGSGGEPYNRENRDATTGAATSMKLQTILAGSSSAQTWYLNVNQNSGSSLEVSEVEVKAVRLR